MPEKYVRGFSDWMMSVGEADERSRGLHNDRQVCRGVFKMAGGLPVIRKK